MAQHQTGATPSPISAMRHIIDRNKYVTWTQCIQGTQFDDQASDLSTIFLSHPIDSIFPMLVLSQSSSQLPGLLMKDCGTIGLWRHPFNHIEAGDSYIYIYIYASLVQIMTCRLSSAKPSSEPMMTYCQLVPQEQTSMKFLSKCMNYLSRKWMWKYHLQNVGHFT